MSESPLKPSQLVSVTPVACGSSMSGNAFASSPSSVALSSITDVLTLSTEIKKRYDLLVSSLMTNDSSDAAQQAVSEALISMLRKGLGSQLFVTGAYASRTFLPDETATLSVFLQPGQERQWFLKAAELLMTQFPSDGVAEEEAVTPPQSFCMSDDINSTGDANEAERQVRRAKSRRATVANVLEHGSSVLLDRQDAQRRNTLPATMSKLSAESHFKRASLGRDTMSVALSAEFATEASINLSLASADSALLDSRRSSSSMRPLDTNGPHITVDTDKPHGTDASSKLVLHQIAVQLGKKKRLQLAVNEAQVVVQSRALSELSFVSLLEDLNTRVGKQDIVKQTLLLFRAWCRFDGGSTSLTLSIPDELREFIAVDTPASANLSWNAAVILIFWLFMRKASVLDHPLSALLHLLVDLGEFDWRNKLDATQLETYDPGIACMLEKVASLRERYASARESEDGRVIVRPVRIDSSGCGIFIADFLDGNVNVADNITETLAKRIQQEFGTICGNIKGLAVAHADNMLVIDRMLAGTWASIEPNMLFLPRSDDARSSYFHVDTANLTKHINFCSFLMDTEMSEAALISVATQILGDRGCLPVGEIGKLLQEATSNPNLPHQLKERFGGLKRFLEANAATFFLASNHPFNPHVYLRSSLTNEQMDCLSRPPQPGVSPPQRLSVSGLDCLDQDGDAKPGKRGKKGKKQANNFAETSPHDVVADGARSTVHSWPPPTQAPRFASAPRNPPMPPDVRAYEMSARTTYSRPPIPPMPPSSMYSAPGSSYRQYAAMHSDAYDSSPSPEAYHHQQMYGRPQYGYAKGGFAPDAAAGHYSAPARASVVSAPSRTFTTPLDPLPYPTSYDHSYLPPPSSGGGEALEAFPAFRSSNPESDPVYNAFSTGNVLGLNFRQQPATRAPPGLEASPVPARPHSQDLSGMRSFY